MPRLRRPYLEPDCHVVVIPSRGAPRATEHVYVGTREIHPLADGCRSFEFIFRCSETGVERRFGYADVPIPRSLSGDAYVIALMGDGSLLPS